MNEKERFFRYLMFEKTDRAPNMEMGVWPETFERWWDEGLPRRVDDLFKLSEYHGLDRSFNCDWIDINNGIHPDPEYRIVEEHDDWEIHENNIGMKFKRTKTNPTIPQYLSFPVSGMSDYERLESLLDPNESGRYPAYYEEDVAARASREEVRGISFVGLFGFARELMGLTGYCEAIYEQPELVDRILDDRVEMAKILYRRALSAHSIDYVQMWEDMAYKSGPFLSPVFMQDKMVERYRVICDVFRGGGVRLIMMDCDGDVEKVIPIVKKGGMEGIYPCEIAAGSDPVKLRKMFPGFALMGGIDKRALAGNGREGAKSELRRIQPVVKDGGYIPFIDHFIPPDISYDTFVYYTKLKSDLMANPGMTI